MLANARRIRAPARISGTSVSATARSYPAGARAADPGLSLATALAAASPAIRPERSANEMPSRVQGSRSLAASPTTTHPATSQ
jgi:hypothetical protein